LITITVLKNPFNHSEKEIHISEYIPGKTANEYVQPYIMGLDDYIVSVNGNVVEDAEEHLVSSDDWLAVCPVVGKSGRDWFRTIGMMALGYVTSGLGNSAAWKDFLGVGKFWGHMAAGAVGMIGGSLISHWFPPAKADRIEAKSSYNWGNAQSQTGQGNALAVTYGTMRTAGQVLAQHVESDNEKQYLNILLCGGEGLIDSISDIRINDNPISYYNDVRVETRLGTNNQTVIANFNDTYDDQALAYELKDDGTWVTQQTEGDAAHGLEITLQFPGGLYHVKDDGSLGNAYVIVKVEYRKVGTDYWNPFVTDTITAKNNIAFFRTYRVDNLTPARYEIRIQCTDKSGDNTTRYSDRVYWTQLSSIMYDDFARPGKVLIGIKALATNQLSGGMPTVTWLQTREKVWVWNPEIRQYEQKPATNPAWAAYDMIHRCRQMQNIHTGNYEFVVQGAPASQAVYQDFVKWAEFCDDYNLTFNYIFDTANDLWTSLQKPEGVGRGKVIMRGTKFGCVCDAPGDPVQLFTVGNMIIDKFKETFVSLKDRANAIEVSFSNKDKAYEKEVITVYADDYDELTEPNITQITLDGITTLEQAYREAKYRLRLNQYLVRTVEHSADIDAIACQINDVVLLAHDVPQWGFSGRILSATATTLQLDRAVTLKPFTSYAIAIQITNPTATTNQEVQSIVTVAVQEVTEETITDTITLASPLSTVPLKWDLYSFGETHKVVKPFRVLNISRDQDLRRKITCLEYIEEIYTEASDVPIINYSSLNPFPEIDQISLGQENYLQKDGTVLSLLRASWTLKRGHKANGYKVWYTRDDGMNWTEFGTVYGACVEIPNVRPNEYYQVKVAALSPVGNHGPGKLSNVVYVTGKDIEPSDVPILRIRKDAVDPTKLIVEWDPVVDLDLKGYELRSGGASWEDTKNVILTPGPITGTTFILTMEKSGSPVIWAKAIDWSGNYSKNAAYASTSVTLEPANVTAFQALQNGEEIFLSWNKVVDPGAVYEIREGGTWDGGTLVMTGLTQTSLTIPALVETSKRYHIKAISKAGKYSSECASFDLTISNLPPKNVILSYNEIISPSGAKTNVEFRQSFFNCLTFNVGKKCSDYPGLLCSDVGGASVLKLLGDNLVATTRLIDGSVTTYQAMGGSVTVTPAVVISNDIDITVFTERYITIAQSIEVTSCTKGQLYCQLQYVKADGTLNSPDHTDWASLAVVTGKTRKIKTLDKNSFPAGTTKIRLAYNWWNATNDSTGTAKIYGDLVVRANAANTQTDSDGRTHFPESGTYAAVQRDLGEVMTVNIGAKFTSSVLLTAGTSTELKFRTSRDGQYWEPWKTFVPAKMTLRYLEYEVNLATTDSLSTPEVNQLELQIDVDDQERAGAASDIPATGKDIAFGYAFKTKPVVTLTAEGASRRAEFTSFITDANGRYTGLKTAKVIDTITNNAVAGAMGWRAKGY
jgi:predicted phage tail protein